MCCFKYKLIEKQELISLNYVKFFTFSFCWYFYQMDKIGKMSIEKQQKEKKDYQILIRFFSNKKFLILPKVSNWLWWIGIMR